MPVYELKKRWAVCSVCKVVIMLMTAKQKVGSLDVYDQLSLHAQYLAGVLLVSIPTCAMF
jgi:hypothetical protein